MTIAAGKSERTGRVMSRRIRLELLKIQLHTVRRPSGDSGSEEVLIFGPDRQLEQECDGDHRPVIGIAELDALAGGLFDAHVEGAIDLLDNLSGLIEERETNFGV